MAAGETAQAQACFQGALHIAPDFAAAHANLGLLHAAGGCLMQAEASYQQATLLNPESPETYINLGLLLARQKRFDAAEAAYRQALACNPASAVAWSNLGVLHACQQQDIEAEKCLRIAIAMDPAYAMAQFNLGYILLRQGRFDEGWRCLDARDWSAPLAARLAHVCSRWQGEPVAGKALLIGYEGGHGDMIQFCRYAALLRADDAAHITLLCHPALKRLFQMLSAVDLVVAYDEPLPTGVQWDYWTPPLSIPLYYKTRLDSIPAMLPYLQVPPERGVDWPTLLPGPGLRVGLAWQGNPAHENDAERSMPALAMLAPLAGVAGVHFVSLQHGVAGRDACALAPPGMDLIDLGSGMLDFADAAALVDGLDLVICVDTALAHLCGALGKPCWVLLPDYQADWRWLLWRTDSPWYPGVLRLFRQAQAGDWRVPMAQVCGALTQLAQAHAAGDA
jgi:tetratricopeptide (TPR) repeat protein